MVEFEHKGSGQVKQGDEVVNIAVFAEVVLNLDSDPVIVTMEPLALTTPQVMKCPDEKTRSSLVTLTL